MAVTFQMEMVGVQRMAVEVGLGVWVKNQNTTGRCWSGGDDDGDGDRDRDGDGDEDPG